MRTIKRTADTHARRGLPNHKVTVLVSVGAGAGWCSMIAKSARAPPSGIRRRGRWALQVRVGATLAFDDSRGRAHRDDVHVRLPGRRTIVAHAFPSTDETFASIVAGALASEREWTTDADELRAAVSRALRQAYPDARLVVQDELGRLIPSQVTWYVFRDGASHGLDEPPRPTP
jgi:hypothetical protein